MVKTKRALAMSALAIVMSVAMLIGSTYAWFTDTVSTNASRIKSGTLNVDIGYENDSGKWVSLEGETLNWKKANDIDEAVLWEPGAKYELREFQIKNLGTLALKYKIVISGATGDLDLLNVLDFTYTIGGETLDLDKDGHLLSESTTEPITIAAKMKESAGNEYQNKEINDIAITVYATQDTVESDSYDDQYDKNATLPEIKTAGNADLLNNAVAELATAGTPKNVMLTVSEDINGANGIKTAKGNELTLDLNEKTVGVNNGKGSTNTATNGMQLLQGSKVTIKNGIFKAQAGNNNATNIAILIQNYSNLTIDNTTLDMTEANHPNAKYVLSTNCGKIVIKGNSNLYAKAGTYALDVMHWENATYKAEGTSVLFDETMTGVVDGKIDVYCYRNGKIVKPVDDGGALLVIKGGTFKNSGLSLDEFKAFVPAGYKVTTNSDGSYTVSK